MKFIWGWSLVFTSICLLFLFFHPYLPPNVCMHIYAHMCVSVCLHLWGGQKKALGVLTYYSLLIPFEGESLPESPCTYAFVYSDWKPELESWISTGCLVSYASARIWTAVLIIVYWALWPAELSLQSMTVQFHGSWSILMFYTLVYFILPICHDLWWCIANACHFEVSIEPFANNN